MFPCSFEKIYERVVLEDFKSVTSLRSPLSFSFSDTVCFLDLKHLSPSFMIIGCAVDSPSNSALGAFSYALALLTVPHKCFVV